MSAAATSRFIEQMGVLLEAEGHPRVAARLMALLLVSTEAMSLDDLAARLEVSKASVSINIRQLEERGTVERISLVGDRRDYYHLADDFIGHSIEQRIARWTRFHDTIRGARKTLTPDSKNVRTRLSDLDLAYEHLIKGMGIALKEWRGRSAASARAGRAS